MESKRKTPLLSALFILGILTGCSKTDILNEEIFAEEPMNNVTEAMDINTPQSNLPDMEEGMTVIFEDDFEGDSETPDPSKWVLCQRTDTDWARHLSESYAQAYQKDGSLFLVGEMKDGTYLTGGIETRGKFDFTYGKVECRARFVRKPQGNHTGIWMMPAPPAEQWPKSGEIDIMEHLNHEEVVYETAHSWYADDLGHKDDPEAQKAVNIDNSEWNVYGLVWDEETLTYTVNGESHLVYPNLHLEGETGKYQWPFDHPFYLILSQSLGGEGTWAGKINDEELPAIFEIDWIRVSQKTDSTGVPVVKAD